MQLLHYLLRCIFNLKMTWFGTFGYKMCEFASKNVAWSTYCMIFLSKHPWLGKKEIRLSPMTEAPTPTQKSKKQRNNREKATKNFHYTTIAGRWRNNSHLRGIIFLNVRRMHRCIYCKNCMMSFWFMNPHPSFEQVSCCICGRWRAAVARHRMIYLVRRRDRRNKVRTFEFRTPLGTSL